MNLSFRSLAAAAALLITLAPAAFAGGGSSANVQGPDRDGRTYTVRTYDCGSLANVRVTAWAEGLVDGKRQTLPLKLKKTGQTGVYQFTRSWPAAGQWAIRMELGSRPHSAVVTSLDEKGVAKVSQVIFDGTGLKQCEAVLAGQDDC